MCMLYVCVPCCSSCLLLALVVLLFVATLYDVVVYRPFMEGGQERVLATETDREITNGSLPTESSQGVLRADEFTPLLNSNPKGKTKGILDEPKQISESILDYSKQISEYILDDPR